MKLKNKSLLKSACYVNGEWVNSSETISVTNPATGKDIATIPSLNQEQTESAISAAHAALLDWKNHSAKERADLLHKWADLIEKNKEDLAHIMTVEQGKPLKEALGEIEYGNSFVRWFAEEGRRVYGDVIPSNKRDQHLVVIKQPVGVVAAITPWNFPHAMITRKVSPALAVGCTVIIKPAEATPLSALALAKLAEEAGIPKGVINIITGDSKLIGKVFTSDARVKKISFTGSTDVGKLLMRQSADTLKKLSLELGGNAPFIVFEDADIEKAVKGAIAAKFRNTGQTCVCANRLYVHEAIYDEFVKVFAKAVSELKVGNGLDDGVTQGPLINEKAVEKVTDLIADAVTKGATLYRGGKPHELGGTYFEPTILTNVTNKMKIFSEEIFGPVAAVYKFDCDEEVIAAANDTQYGLASYFYSQNIDRVWRVAEQLEYGMVGVNTGMVSTEVAPFGGVKESGMGREGSKYGVDDYLEIKYICMA